MRKPKEQPEQIAQPKWWQSPLYAGLTLLLAVVGIGLAVYFYMSSREQKVPVYNVESTTLVSPSTQIIPDLTMFYRNKAVDRVSSTNIRIWNAGRKTIDAADISQADRLRIVVPPGAAILALRIVKCTGPNATPRLSQRGRTIVLNVEFLDQDDGCMVQILHTGSASAEWKVAGRIKGAVRISRADATVHRFWKSTTRGMIVIWTITLLPLTVLIWSARRRAWDNSDRVFFAGLLLVIAMSLYGTLVNISASHTIPLVLR